MRLFVVLSTLGPWDSSFTGIVNSFTLPSTASDEEAIFNFCQIIEQDPVNYTLIEECEELIEQQEINSCCDGGMYIEAAVCTNTANNKQFFQFLYEPNQELHFQ